MDYWFQIYLSGLLKSKSTTPPIEVGVFLLVYDKLCWLAFDIYVAYPLVPCREIRCRYYKTFTARIYQIYSTLIKMPLYEHIISCVPNSEKLKPSEISNRISIMQDKIEKHIKPSENSVRYILSYRYYPERANMWIIALALLIGISTARRITMSTNITVYSKLRKLISVMWIYAMSFV